VNWISHPGSFPFYFFLIFGFWAFTWPITSHRYKRSAVSLALWFRNVGQNSYNVPFHPFFLFTAVINLIASHCSFAYISRSKYRISYLQKDIFSSVSLSSVLSMQLVSKHTERMTWAVSNMCYVL